MLSSITPLGERGRHSRWGMTVTAYLLGSLAAATGLGAVLGALGGLLPVPGRPVVLAVALLAGAVADATSRTPARPRRQVDEDWLARYRGWVYGVGFGFQLGLGVVTILSTAAVLALWLAALLTGSALFGALLGTAFGAARAAPVFAMRRVVDPATLRRLFGRLEAARRPAARATVVGQAALAVLGLAAWGWSG
jgi:hypothetical protein